MKSGFFCRMSLVNRRVSFFWVATVIGLVCLCGVRTTSAQPLTGMPGIRGDTLRRVNAMTASNLALSPENTPSATFKNVVSLGDADVIARAQALSIHAGHNGLHYDYFRFMALFDKARLIKADKIDIPAATYRIYPPQNLAAGASIIEASLLSHVVIDGHGAMLSFASIGDAEVPLDKTAPRSAIHLGQDDHVTLRNLALDWYEPLVVPVKLNGTGQAGSPEILTVDSAFPVKAATPIPIRVILPYNVARRKFIWSRELSRDDYAAWAAEHSGSGHMPYLCASPLSGGLASACFRWVGGQAYTFAGNERLTPLPLHADNFLGSTRDNSFGAIVVDGGTSFLNLAGVTIYTSPGQGLVLINAGKALHVKQVRVLRKPDASLQAGEAKRFVSTLSDAIDVISCAGDIVIEDSEFADEADDGLNIRAGQIHASAVGPNIFSATAAAVSNFYRLGGLIDVYDANGNNLVAASVPITAVRSPTPGARNYTVTMAPLASALEPGKSYQIRVLDYDSARVIVRNNWFHDNTERGVVVHNDSIMVIGNRFDRNAESAVQLLYDNQSDNAEGAAASNVIIAGNLIHDVNINWFDPAFRLFAAPSAISVYFMSRGAFLVNADDTTGNVMVRHLDITDNMITDVPGAGILVSQADDVILARNTVLRSNQHTFYLPLIDGHGIIVERTTHLTTSDNSSDRPVDILSR